MASHPSSTVNDNNKNDLMRRRSSSGSPDSVRTHAINEIFNRPKRGMAETSQDETIPLVTHSSVGRPPLARHDTTGDLDDDDTREVVEEPYPGVDDGFFPDRPTNDQDPDVEMIPSDIEPMDGEDEIPEITPRAGPDGGSNPADEGDGAGKPLNPKNNHFPGRFPYAPGFGVDVETGTIPDLDSIPDVNVYQHKKTLAQGMMDLALFSANANQLRYVLESSNVHPYYYPSIVLISISLIFQVAVGIGLIWNATYNVKDDKEICIANRISNFTIIGIFLVTVVNVFISAFGVANVQNT